MAASSESQWVHACAEERRETDGMHLHQPAPKVARPGVPGCRRRSCQLGLWPPR